MIPSRSFLLGSLHSLLFSKVLEGFGPFFIQVLGIRATWCPLCFVYHGSIVLHFCIFSSGIKCLMQFLFCFFAVFLGYVMHDYLFTDFYQFLAWKFQYSLACFGFCQCWRWEIMRILWQYRLTHLGFRNIGREREREDSTLIPSALSALESYEQN